jgi:hypothetical protein
VNRRIAAALAAFAVFALALPTLAQQGQLVRFTGQLLDVRGGYVYFTSGDAFKLAAAPRIADYDTGKPTALQPRAKLFARAILDPATKQVVELDLTTRRLATDAAYAPDVQSAIATKPITTLAPEIAGVYHSGKDVPVEFLVTVPPTTPINADVYISTDASGWNPQAIKLDRIDGQRYRAVRRLASGTKFSFRVTRGTWNTVEIGENGLAADVHSFVINEVDSQSRRVTVFGWSDDRGNPGAAAPAAPGAIPTPFNPNPFPPGGIAPPPRVTPPGGFPTARPGSPNQPPH